MKRIAIILLLIVAIGNSYAQILPGASTVFDVNGLVFNKTYTDAQMRAALGTPISYQVQNSSEENLRIYIYGSIDNPEEFMHSNLSNIGFFSFVIRTPNFKLFGGQLKVGDNISKVPQLKLGRLEIVGRGEYYLYINNVSDDPLRIRTNSQGVITSMSKDTSI